MADLSFSVGLCRYGAASMLASPQGILAIDLGDTKEELQALAKASNSLVHSCNSNEQRAWWEHLLSYIEEPTEPFEAPLVLKGAKFQLEVYAELQGIEAGLTITYADLSAALNLKNGARAVAGICARNKLALAVPCHRVVGQQGKLTGYRWGKSRKAAILRHEAALTGTSAPSLLGI